MDWNGLLNFQDDPQRNMLMQVGLGLLAGNQSGNAAAGAMRGFQNAQELINARQRQKVMEEEMAMRKQDQEWQTQQRQAQVEQQKRQQELLGRLPETLGINPDILAAYPEIGQKLLERSMIPQAPAEYGLQSQIGRNPATGKWGRFVQDKAGNTKWLDVELPPNIAAWQLADETGVAPSSYLPQGNTQPQPMQNNAPQAVPASPSAMPTNNFTTPYPVTWSGPTATDVKEGTSPDMQLRNPATPNLPPKTQRALTQKQAEAQIDIGKEVALSPIKTQQAADEKAAVTLAESQAQGQIDLPGAIAKGEETIKLLNELESHPGFKTAVGASSLYDPRNYLPGTDARGFGARLEQLRGRTFLEAYESLKGSGQITEVEGAKAEKALARMDVSTSEPEFKQAIKDFKAAIRSGVNKAKMRAGNNKQPSAQVEGQTSGKTVVRRGKYNGRSVVEYSDGSVDYAD